MDTPARSSLGLTVLIPLKDEAGNIPLLAREIAEALSPLALEWEVLWVDDGSTDGSLAALEALPAEEARHRYLSFDRNYGQSAALLAGFHDARGAVVATMDADLQNDPRDLPRLLEELGTGGVDMVNGVRTRRRDNWLRKVSSKIANGFRNWLTGEEITDVGCSLRVVRREFVESLPSFRGMHRFLPTLVRLQGGRVSELPVGHRPRAHGQTKYGVNNRLWVGLLDTLGVRWLKSRWVMPRIRLRGGGVPDRESDHDAPRGPRAPGPWKTGRGGRDDRSGGRPSAAPADPSDRTTRRIGGNP